MSDCPTDAVYLRRFFVSAMLRSPGGLGSGNGSGRAVLAVELRQDRTQIRPAGEHRRSGRSSNANPEQIESPAVGCRGAVVGATNMELIE